jgi:hypothetical protein
MGFEDTVAISISGPELGMNVLFSHQETEPCSLSTSGSPIVVSPIIGTNPYDFVQNHNPRHKLNGSSSSLRADLFGKPEERFLGAKKAPIKDYGGDPNLQTRHAALNKFSNQDSSLKSKGFSYLPDRNEATTLSQSMEGALTFQKVPVPNTRELDHPPISLIADNLRDISADDFPGPLPPDLEIPWLLDTKPLATAAYTADMKLLRRVQTADSLKAFENTSTSVAASQMRNALNNLADSVEDPKEKKVCSHLERGRIKANPRIIALRD